LVFLSVPDALSPRFCPRFRLDSGAIFSFGLGWLSFVFSQLVVFRLHLLPVALVTTAFACYGVGFHFSFV
jgi:hypothetical protein